MLSEKMLEIVKGDVVHGCVNVRNAGMWVAGVGPCHQRCSTSIAGCVTVKGAAIVSTRSKNEECKA